MSGDQLYQTVSIRHKINKRINISTSYNRKKIKRTYATDCIYFKHSAIKAREIKHQEHAISCNKQAGSDDDDLSTTDSSR